MKSSVNKVNFIDIYNYATRKYPMADAGFFPIREQPINEEEFNRMIHYASLDRDRIEVGPNYIEIRIDRFMLFKYDSLSPLLRQNLGFKNRMIEIFQKEFGYKYSYETIEYAASKMYVRTAIKDHITNFSTEIQDEDSEEDISLTITTIECKN
jgi:hypothetical protein